MGPNPRAARQDAPEVREVPTPSGPARLHLDGPPGAPLVALGHGAGGGVDAVDLLAARDAALGLGLRVVRVEQPWRVRGRKVAEAPPRLDAAWSAALDGLEPLVVGGRSAGARVACRTAGQLGARGVLCLAFPLHPPGRPQVTRDDELRGPGVPVLVVQGTRDAFGVPGPGGGVAVHLVDGADHALRVRKADGRSPAEVAAQVRAAVAGWLAGQVLT